MKRYCLALDLKDDAQLISAYEEYHRHVPDAIVSSIKDAGIEAMEIYRTGNRLLMVMEVNDTFDFARKAQADHTNVQVQDWEELMGQYQQALPWAKKGEKWVLMSPLFELNKQTI